MLQEKKWRWKYLQTRNFPSINFIKDVVVARSLRAKSSTPWRVCLRLTEKLKVLPLLSSFSSSKKLYVYSIHSPTSCKRFMKVFCQLKMPIWTYLLYQFCSCGPHRTSNGSLRGTSCRGCFLQETLILCDDTNYSCIKASFYHFPFCWVKTLPP